ncbi:MAG: lysylphosphatidylglycerol synthase domain-containing protein, partial [Limnothrix sp.]
MSIDLKKSAPESLPNNKKVWQRLLSTLSLVICGLAIAAVYQGLKNTNWLLVWADLQDIKPLQLAQALLFVAGSYGAIACYDVLAFRYIECQLALSKIIFAGLITYSISPNVGFAFLSGGVLRYRIYRQWQVSNFDIAKIIAFTNFSLWVGLIPITGFVFVATEFSLPEAIAESFPSISPPELGILLLVISGLYLLIVNYIKKPFEIKNAQIKLPSLGLTLQQIIVFSLDWGFAAGTLYFLLGNPLSFPFFFGIYVIAMVAGLISTVPGGLGVFETVMLFFLESLQPKEEILATLIVFRCLYYFLPFTIAVV